MSRGIGLLSNRVRKIPSTEIDSKSPDRFTFLDVASTEPDLGVPPDSGYFLTSDVIGNRQWLPPDQISLNGEENELVFIKNGVSSSTTNIEYNEDTDSLQFHNAYHQRGSFETLTFDSSSLTEGVIARFDKTNFGSAKYVIQADDPQQNQRQLSELLVVHNGTQASATEFGIIHTTEQPFSSFDVQISDNFVELIARNLTQRDTVYRVVETLFLI
jgi:hypothetical protein